MRRKERRVVQCTVTCIFWRRARLIEISLLRVGGHRWYFVDSVVEVREGGSPLSLRVSSKRGWLQVGWFEGVRNLHIVDLYLF